MLLHFANHFFPPSRNSIISLTYMWLCHCEGATCYEPKTSFGSFQKWLLLGLLLMEKVNDEGHSFHISGKRVMMTEANISHKGSSESRENLGDIHISQVMWRDSFFYVPFFLTIILIVVHVTLYLKCRKVQNNFNPISSYSDEDKKTQLFLFLKWIVGSQN